MANISPYHHLNKPSNMNIEILKIQRTHLVSILQGKEKKDQEL